MLPRASEKGSLARSSDELRMELEGNPDCRFVERDEFVQLLIGTKELIRADEASAGLRGLRDMQSNLRFLIDETELFGVNSGSSRFPG